MIPPNNSLVKYDNPQLVVKDEKPDKKDKKSPTAGMLAPAGGRMAPCGPKSKSGSLDVRDVATQQTIEVLNALIPPREWQEENNKWTQQVSSNPATRIDVVTLQEELDRRLQQRQARETGICPVRRELYTQCFDELIRQVTLNCSERGLMLVRVRDEIRMTIAAYQTLYESSVAFGMRKALQAEHGKTDLEKMVAKLENDKRELEQQLNEQKTRCDLLDKKAIEQKSVLEKQHQEEVQFLKRTNQQLKTQLEGIIVPKK